MFPPRQSGLTLYYSAKTRGPERILNDAFITQHFFSLVCHLWSKLKTRKGKGLMDWFFYYGVSRRAGGENLLSSSLVLTLSYFCTFSWPQVSWIRVCDLLLCPCCVLYCSSVFSFLLPFSYKFRKWVFCDLGYFWEKGKRVGEVCVETIPLTTSGPGGPLHGILAT